MVQTLLRDEAVLLFVYRLQQKYGTNYASILLRELESAGVDIHAKTTSGHDRVVVQTWGCETSLRSERLISLVVALSIAAFRKMQVCFTDLDGSIHCPMSVSPLVINEVEKLS